MISLASKRFLLSLPLLILVVIVSDVRSGSAGAQEASSASASGETNTSASTDATGALQLQVKTDSPRETLASFIRLRDALERGLAAYREDRSSENAKLLALIFYQMKTLFDFSHIPIASRQDLGSETAAYVLDILGRIALPDLYEVPDLATVEVKGLDYYAIPGTPLRLVRMGEGPRIGEFLFSAQTVQTAPWFYRGVERLPLRSSLPIESWVEGNRQLTGPMIPAAFVAAVPAGLKHPLFGTPVWKVMVVVAAVFIATILLVFLHRVLRPGEDASRRAGLWRRLSEPLAVAAAASAIQGFSIYQLNVAGEFALGLDLALNGILYVALAWAVWLATLAVFEMLIGRRSGSAKDIDANMLRLLARIVGVICVIIILAAGAQAVGVSVISIVAGLGVGGLAVALAIRPTLENLIGGLILYLDEPIRVGDFCGFGSQSGTVENIGVRSTQIRAPDRTLISIPNAQFADMQIINWTQRDQMLIQETIGLRYETGGDQLRYVLAKMREMFCSHPGIDPETVRVRFAGYGSSSLDISIRVYAKTREANDFFAIKEDVLLRVKEIVESSGTGFAFPSQTLYLGRDKGPDAELTDMANSEVASWRRSGRLPFPYFASAALKRFAGKIKYPPAGSPDYHATEEELTPGDQPAPPRT